MFGSDGTKSGSGESCLDQTEQRVEVVSRVWIRRNKVWKWRVVLGSDGTKSGSGESCWDQTVEVVSDESWLSVSSRFVLVINKYIKYFLYSVVSKNPKKRPLL